MPQINAYDGLKDLVDQIETYKAHMELQFVTMKLCVELSNLYMELQSVFDETSIVLTDQRLRQALHKPYIYVRPTSKLVKLVSVSVQTGCDFFCKLTYFEIPLQVFFFFFFFLHYIDML